MQISFSCTFDAGQLPKRCFKKWVLVKYILSFLIFVWECRGRETSLPQLKSEIEFGVKIFGHIGRPYEISLRLWNYQHLLFTVFCLFQVVRGIFSENEGLFWTILLKSYISSTQISLNNSLNNNKMFFNAWERINRDRSKRAFLDKLLWFLTPLPYNSFSKFLLETFKLL